MRSVSSLFALGVALLITLGTPGRGDDAATSEFFNGKDLEGWEGLTKFWTVKEGALTGSTFPDGNKFNTFLCSKKKYKDFELQFKVRLTGKGWSGNSGVQIRSEVFDRKHFAVKGPQCDMGDAYWGSVYGEHFGDRILKQAPAAVDDDLEIPEEGIIAWQLHGGGPMKVTFKYIKFKDLSAK